MKTDEDDEYYGYSNSGMDHLKGKTITKVDFTPDKIRFTLDKGKPLVYRVEGDCCSYSWFYKLENVQTLLNLEVKDIVEIDISYMDTEDDEYYVDKYYGIGLKTDKGVFKIKYVNTSNGYYGGWIQLDTSVDVGNEWKALTEDWKAEE